MKKLIIAAAAMAVSTGALAGPSWTYVDLGYVFGNSDLATGEDTSGAALRGSFGFGNIWHIQAAVAGGEINGGKSPDFQGTDFSSYEIRGGIHPAVTDNTDFVLDIGYTGSELEFCNTQPCDNDKTKPSAFDIRTGVRANVGQLELRSFLSWNFVDSDSSDNTFDGEGQTLSYAVGAQYNFSDAWSVGIDTEILDSDNLSDLYVRWSF